MDNTAHRANQKLDFIRRNLRGSSITSKCLAYTSLARSGMEYAASIWDLVSKVDIRKLEMVQRKAARWAKSCFSQSTSVTKMLQDLKWDDLADRRKNIRLTRLYKICNKNVDIEYSEIGQIPSTIPFRRHQTKSQNGRAEELICFQNNHWMEHSPSRCYSGWLCQRFQEPPNCDASMWRLPSVLVLVHVELLFRFRFRFRHSWAKR